MKLFLKRVINKFKYAIAGFIHGIVYDKSIRLQVVFGCIVIVVGCILPMEVWEWCFLIISIFLVIAFEYINSALEHIMDMISPEYHATVKVIKDYAAAAVLIVSIMAAIIGIIIIGGKVLCLM